MTNKAKLLITFMAMLIFLSLGTDDLSAQNILIPDAPTWRLVSFENTSNTSYGSDGTYQKDSSDYYYSSNSSTRADSTVVKIWRELGGNPSVRILTHSYIHTVFPAYYEKVTISKTRPENYGDTFRYLERFDYAHRPLLYIVTRNPDFENKLAARNDYSYDEAGNLLQKIESRPQIQQDFGPKYVIRYSYRPDGKLLTKIKYTVINNDLENLELRSSEKRIYDSEGLHVASVSRYSEYTTSFYKTLLDYNLDGLESKRCSYRSSDSLNWIPYASQDTAYGESFGEYQPFRKDNYTYSSSDSTAVIDSSYQLFYYQDLNRDISSVSYDSDGNSIGNVHSVYNEDMKLVLNHTYSQSSAGCEIHHTVNVWEMAVSNDDLVQEVPGLSLSVYPNPFSATSKICYSLKDSGTIKLELYNLRGQKVKTLISEGKAAGEHELDMDLTDLNLASGVYILRASSNGASTGQKLMLLK